MVKDEQRNSAVKGREPLLSAAEVAELLHVKRSTVYEWARMNYIPSISLGIGRNKPPVRFDRLAVEEWLESKRKAGRILRIPANKN